MYHFISYDIVNKDTVQYNLNVFCFFCKLLSVANAYETLERCIIDMMSNALYCKYPYIFLRDL